MDHEQVDSVSAALLGFEIGDRVDIVDGIFKGETGVIVKKWFRVIRGQLWVVRFDRGDRKSFMIESNMKFRGKS